MAIIRQQNWLGQQRVDVADLRALESAVSNDFDILAGKLLAGRQPLVARGFTISVTNAAGNPADQLQLNIAGGLMLHFGSSESGTLFVADDNASPEVLSATNAKVEGSFTASATNYVGLDLIRSEDSDTSDLKQFLDANTKLEIPKTVPTARTLSYRIIISTQPFSISTNILPIAKVVTTSGNAVDTITDARSMMFRLGSGGDSPDANNSYLWTDTARQENAITFDPPTSSDDPFAGGDKEITSMKEWMDAVMTRLWEVGSGRAWYSPTTRDNIKLIFGLPVLGSTSDNFEWSDPTLEWASLKVVFENSTGYHNVIQDGTANLTADGQCLYVDLNRDTDGATIIPVVATLEELGSPNIPGSRYVIAWRVDDEIFVRDRSFELGRDAVVASTSVTGIVRLSRAASTPSTPIVISDTGGTIASTGNDRGLTVTGSGTGVGIHSTGGSTAAYGLHGVGGATNGSGVGGQGVGTGTGVVGSGGSSSGAGVTGFGGATNGIGVAGLGDGTGGGVVGTGGDNGGYGVIGTGGVTNGGGGYFAAVGTGAGVTGVGVTNSDNAFLATTGGASIPAAANYKYTTAVTRYAVCSAVDFHLVTDGATTTFFEGTIDATTINAQYWLMNGLETLECHFKIPAGAVIKGLDLCHENVASISATMQAAHYAIPATTINATPIVAASTAVPTDSSGNTKWTTVSSGLSVTMDSTGWVTARITADDDHQYRLYAMRIVYEQTNVTPAV